jgi:hypothetical protein
MLMPLLSAKDPAVSSEGTLDPLGLYQIADALALQLIPGIRERMRHPRFLTLTAVSLAVCNEFDYDALAKDGVSEPWQVFEWYVVEGLVRCAKDKEFLRGLPGTDKVTRSIHDNIPLSTRSYLKTANVFGFHGVYRLLSRTLNIDVDGRLGESGYRLLNVWREEQGLPDFYDSSSGKGFEVIKTWRDAVRDGLAKGAVDRSSAWQGWQLIADHLAPHGASQKEQHTLRELIFSYEKGFIRKLVQFMISPVGSGIVKQMRIQTDEGGTWSERPFHEALRKAAEADLRALLEAILTYETFARLLQDAFEDCLCEMTKYKGKTPVTALAECQNVKKAAERIPMEYAGTMDKLALFGELVRFQQLFSSLADKGSPHDWVERLLQHHIRVQKNKPPNGKLPWFERFDDGSCIIRQDYIRDKGGRGDDSYVHPYRLNSLWTFATDMGMI